MIINWRCFGFFFNFLCLGVDFVRKLWFGIEKKIKNYWKMKVRSLVCLNRNKWLLSIKNQGCNITFCSINFFQFFLRREVFCRFLSQEYRSRSVGKKLCFLNWNWSLTIKSQYDVRALLIRQTWSLAIQPYPNSIVR